MISENHNKFFNQVEKQFNLQIPISIKNLFSEYLYKYDNNTINLQIIGRRSGKILFSKLQSLWRWYDSNMLNNVVMLTDYFQIIQDIQDTNKKTKSYNIVPLNSNIIIGEIKWYSPWRKYCLYGYYNTVFDSKCLNEITYFLDVINKQHREEIKK